jgi:hypothetical protein
MNSRIFASTVFTTAVAGFALAAEAPKPPMPLVYTNPVPVAANADGGLRPAVGVQNIQVFRANRTAPAHADKLAHTYTHAPMLAWWHGKFYLEFLSGPRDEHQSPCVTSLTTSTDGLTWETPRVIFPEFPLPDGKTTIAHQRMGFFTAPDDRLLVLAFYGKSPAPNDGTGIGRAVREIHRDGTLGPIYFIRLNAKQPFPDLKLPYALYSTSPDAGFVAACNALLANKLYTAQWWEEDALDESGFYKVRGKALSFVRRPDKSVLGIWKNTLVATMPNNASKYWLQHTADNRYALFFNPTNRLRFPLAVLTSPDCANFSDLLYVHGELPDQRFGGGYKNLGPQYVRGIEEGNGTPPDAATTTWLTYSVNKEDIWVARIPTPITAVATAPVNDNFDSAAAGTLPIGWNTYSPLWAPVRVVDAGGSAKHALEFRDEDPYDYARAVRVFPETHGLKLAFKVLAKQTNARFEIDLQTANGGRPVRLAVGEDGHLWACHEGQWMDAGEYAAGKWINFELEIPRNPRSDTADLTVDGKKPLFRAAVFTEPAATMERLSFRTGVYRDHGYGGRDLPGADVKVPAAVFLVDDVVVTPQK